MSTILQSLADAGLQGHVLSVAVSPDGAWVAWGATDHGIHFGDPLTGLVQLTLKGHSNTGLLTSFAYRG